MFSVLVSITRDYELIGFLFLFQSGVRSIQQIFGLHTAVVDARRQGKYAAQGGSLRFVLFYDIIHTYETELKKTTNASASLWK